MGTKATLLVLSSASLVGAVSAGCGDASGEGGNPNTTYVGLNGYGAEGGGSPASCDTERLDLDGLWAVKVTLPMDVAGVAGNSLSVCPASQEGDVTMVLLMDVVSLAPSHSASFNLCFVQLPAFTFANATTCGGDTFDMQLLPAERMFDNDDEPLTIDVASEDPGASFTLEPIVRTYGAFPLPEWDTASEACNDPLLGHGGCEETCVGGCEEIDTFDNDEPGVNLAMCGLGDGEILEDCNPFDPGGKEGNLVEGMVYAAMRVANTFTGTFNNSCEGASNVETDLDMSYMGGNVFVQGLKGAVQLNVTDQILGLPTFTLASHTASATFTRIDGKYASSDFDEGDVGDTCETLFENLGSLP